MAVLLICFHCSDVSNMSRTFNSLQSDLCRPAAHVSYIALFFDPSETPPAWASGSAPISRFPAEGAVTDVTDAAFHIFCPCGAKEVHVISVPERVFLAIFGARQ